MAANLQAVTLALRAGERAIPILKGITLGVERGARLAIVGASGSGKTSLLSILGGLERPTSGTVEVAGIPLAGLDEDALARVRRAHIGIIPQAFHLIPTMTAAENVMVPLELAGRKRARETACAALEAVGLGARAGHFPAELSGGEQQRVAIARALVPDPDLILADEPTGNLDSETGAAVIALLFERVAATGTALVLVTHDAALAERCDRVLHMRDGILHPAGAHP